jgi:23S rRNA (adenine2503-C2)-methyltransferase
VSVDLDRVAETLGDAPSYRPKQVWEWAARGASSFAEMTNVPARERALLEEQVPFSTLVVQHEARSKDGTVKALFRTHDGHPVEAVLMRYRDGRRSV